MPGVVTAQPRAPQPADVSYPNLVVNVKSVGAKGDDTTSDLAVVQQALNIASRVYFPPGRYWLPGILTVPAGTSIEIDANAVLDFSGASSSQTCIQITGTEGNPVALTGDAVAGNTVLNVPGTGNFAIGDYVRIASTRLYDPGQTNQNDGEVGVVTAVTAGTVTLASPLVGINYTVANAASIAKLTMVRKVSIRGGTIVGVAGGTQNGIRAWRAVDVRITDVSFQNIYATGVWFIDVVFGVVDGVHVEYASDAGTGYGVSISDASQDILVSNCEFFRCRHATTVTGTSLASGIPRRIYFISCRSVSTVSTGDAFDCHAGAESVHWRDCQSFDSSGSGFNIECAKASVVACVTENAAVHGIVFDNCTAAATELSLVGNMVRNPTQMGIRVVNAALVGAGAVVRYVNIGENTVFAPGGRPIFVASTDTWRFKNVSITGNVIDSPGDTTNGIQLQQADSCNVNGNSITNVPGAAAAIRIADVTKSVIMGNTTLHAANTTGRALSITSGVELTIIGNVGNTANQGIVTDAGSTDCTIIGNSMRSTTTPYSILGSRHIARYNVPSAALTGVASAGTVTLPQQGEVFQITGTTGITAITAGTAQREVTLIFAGALTVTSGGNLILNGNFVTAANSTLTLVSDGTSWFEKARKP